jgi:hypothetical protein
MDAVPYISQTIGGLVIRWNALYGLPQIEQLAIYYLDERPQSLFIQVFWYMDSELLCCLAIQEGTLYRFEKGYSDFSIWVYTMGKIDITPAESDYKFGDDWTADIVVFNQFRSEIEEDSTDSL